MELLSEQKKYKKVLIQYLEENQSLFLNEWNETIKVNEIDPYKEKIKENGYGMYSLVINIFNGSLSNDVLTKLAYQVANERLKANINIGDFLYNINLGRNIIVRNVFGANIPIKYIQKFIDEINTHFDTFSYHAVTRYTNLTNEVIEEKQSFISENHKDKLAVLGQISSSFVHEFRNPLTAIMGFNKLLIRENPNLKYLDIIDYELNQLNFRITQFLHTSKSDFNEEQREEISVLELLEEIQQLTYASIVDASVNVEIDIYPNFVITASKDGLKQVFLNLFINSIDALKGKDQPRTLKIHTMTEPNERVIRISNNGPAIASEMIESIFEPFFTTKELGTGIGLYVCKKIIESNDGYMNCVSNDNLTTFSIHFPNS
ncbi:MULTISPECIES: histidine kinase N-terminal domain-containing protein [unclassified Peribacillus]|uniref:histidine kinase N-terminal domain-containing protein n=1 Tax=unclassified Peribacillus TaxID=2675266 RepID=UPI00191493BE|nr:MULTISPECIES: histidine kinase N-terminal domain-containing protein [unclassified Peribacillus]MBK5483393.1 GHKL domain-containing protein [Peribacillus sp. TH16]MBK5501497.1 GHKL domain-containing protein [Peribacillus sp. TH14]WMX53569.1 histidine kinase N-terminal domain-containing protein [Peribacillus sp. R9-11]